MDPRRPPKRPHPFSIMGLLSHLFPPPLPKRARHFIDDMIGAGTSSEMREPKDYVKKIDEGNPIYNEKFKTLKVKTRYSIEEVGVDPEAMLAGIFQYCIDEAIKRFRARGLSPVKLGCTVSSELLMPDIWTPLRSINENTVEAILNRFLQVAQSKKQQGMTLWGSPFTVCVTTVDSGKLPTERTLKGGARRVLAPVHHQVNDKSLIKIDNTNNKYCLFYALQATLKYTIGAMTDLQFFYYKHSKKGMAGKFEKDTLALMEKVGAPLNLNGYEAEKYVPKVLDYWNEKYEGCFRFKLFVFGALGHYKPLYKYGPEEYNVPLLLFFNNKHFDGVAKMNGLFASRKYCLSCEAAYNEDRTHRTSCRARCLNCSRVGPIYPCKPFVNYNVNCKACSKTFTNKDCYDHHIQSKFCQQSKKCLECGVIYDLRENTRNGRSGHVCGETYCTTCNEFHDVKRGCFIQPEKVTTEKPCRFVAFDLETMQHQPVDPDTPSKRMHEPNFISARVSCPDCIRSGEWKNSLNNGQQPCAACGPHRTITFSHRPFSETTVDKQVTTENPLKEFTNWLLYGLPLKYDTVAFSHFGGRFDMVLTFRELFAEGLNPSMIRNGNKLYEMKALRTKKNPQVIFRDSFNLFPLPLAELPKTFGLDVEDKPFFPHLANRPENYGRHIHPTKEDYIAAGFKPDKRAKFDEWFDRHGEEPFLLDEALASYCCNDVDILMSALIAFRTEFMDVTRRPATRPGGKADRAAYETPHDGIDVLRECMTIASACMKHFAANHLRAHHVGIVPERGYDYARTHNQSLLAHQFLSWYEKKHGVKIQSAFSAAGEKKVGRFELDGWIESEKRGIEVDGCFFHGCDRCYPNPNLVMPNGKTVEYMRENSKQKLAFIRAAVGRVDVYRECEIREMLKKDEEMRQHFAEYDVEGSGPIDIRSAFMGGRTGPLKLFREVKLGEKISYYDFTSLYPFINFFLPGGYPVGHPTVDVRDEDVNWTCPKDNPYKLAILKVRVVPPRQCDVPVLPVKVNDRLCFPLCITCARQHPKGGVMKNYSCRHTDKERSWVSTCTSLELDAALEEGYRVTWVNRVLQYTVSDEKLFRPYISEFMAQKIHASGFDARIAGNKEAETEFIRDCAERFNIKIDPSKMVPNKGKRYLAKLALNNLWGRFSMRNNLPKTTITDDPSVLGKMLNDEKIDIMALDELDSETMMITHESKDDFVEEHKYSNIVISLFTTSAARLQLLKAMQMVVRSPGCELLYTDTDSLIFVHPADANPLQTGPHLGDFTDEYPHHEILEFCSGGAKQYGLKLRKCDDNSLDYVLKVRGMTISFDVMHNQGLRYDTFKTNVLEFARTGCPPIIDVLYPNSILPSIKDANVISAPRRKIYKPFVGKGIVCSHSFRVLDFGYVNPHPPIFPSE